MNMFGILNINKPPGWTSRDAVNRVQRLVRPAKVGHAGTLDPLATGVLVVCIGPATRLIDYVQQMVKEYRGTFLLGRKSASDDIETEVTELACTPIPSLSEVEAVLPQFLGRIDQIPPAYSAVKIAGQRAYALARQGKEVTISPRPVEIFDIQITTYEYPKLELLIHCGSGTYIRSLGRDLAECLGSGAVMSELVRTCIGDFRVEQAISPVDLTLNIIQEHLLPPHAAVSHLPVMPLSADQSRELSFGRTIAGSESQECTAVDEQGNLIAILKEKSPGLLKPHINFAPSA
jgi:tRNA pseudouridine55 synthase